MVHVDRNALAPVNLQTTMLRTILFYATNKLIEGMGVGWTKSMRLLCKRLRRNQKLHQPLGLSTFYVRQHQRKSRPIRTGKGLKLYPCSVFWQRVSQKLILYIECLLLVSRFVWLSRWPKTGQGSKQFVLGNLAKQVLTAYRRRCPCFCSAQPCPLWQEKPFDPSGCWAGTPIA